MLFENQQVYKLFFKLNFKLSFVPGKRNDVSLDTEFLCRRIINIRGNMSINIQTNIGPATTGLSEQGTFRNSMYQEQEKEKKEKQKNLVRPAASKDHVSAHFMINEDLRLKSTGLQNEISHLEEEMSIVQIAASALENVEVKLIEIMELLVIVSKEIKFNSVMREADQQELVRLIKRINTVADETSYGHQSLLDGSYGVRGVATGEFLDFVMMNTNSKTSPLSGYEVLVTEAATRSELKGFRPFTQDIVDHKEQLIFEEGGTSNSFITHKGESVSATFHRLADWISQLKLPLEIVRNVDNILHLRHLQYGSAYSFKASSFTPGLLSLEGQKVALASPGLDLKGRINGIPCLGHGQYLSVPAETEDISGLTVRYYGSEAPVDKVAGTVSVIQNGFQFRVGIPEPHIELLSLASIHTSNLGVDTENVSGFNSLEEIDIQTEQRIKDSICVLEKSMKEISEVRDRVKVFCETTFNDSMKDLRNEYEKLVITEKNIENSVEAHVFAEQTGNIIAKNLVRSTEAQAHQNHETVLSLLK